MSARCWAAAVALSLLTVAVAKPASAGPRSPVYIDMAAGLGVHPVLGAQMDVGTPVSIDVKLGAGIWLRQRIAVFGQIGFTPKLSLSDEGITGQVSGVEEKFRYVPLRGGAKLNLWPRPDWIQVNLVGAASIAVGVHELSLGTGVQAKESFFSVGAGGGIELNLVKFKRAGMSLSAMYFVQPAFLSENTGFRATGLTDLGGVEVWFGFMKFLGGPS